ncbi:MAG: hypothetical protein ACTSRU_08245 [Candidatus Hodarchaeales archaeon]
MIVCKMCLTENDDDAVVCSGCNEEIERIEITPPSTPPEEEEDDEGEDEDDDETEYEEEDEGEDVDEDDIEDDDEEDEDKDEGEINLDDEYEDEEETFFEEKKGEKGEIPSKIKKLIMEVDNASADAEKWKREVSNLKKEVKQKQEKIEELQDTYNSNIKQISMRQEKERDLENQIKDKNMDILNLSWAVFHILRVQKRLSEIEKQKFKQSKFYRPILEIFKKFVQPRREELDEYEPQYSLRIEVG